MIIELYRATLRNKYHGNIDKMIKDEYYTAWNPRRIKSAFNRGHGTEKHLRSYMENNAKICLFLDMPAD